MSAKLPKNLTVTLTTEHKECLEYNFSTASYNDMVNVITALRTVCGHLIKVTLFLLCKGLDIIYSDYVEPACLIIGIHQ